MKALISAAMLLLFSHAAMAENIYKDGSYASLMYKTVENIIPSGMNVFFVKEGNRAYFDSQVDPAALEKSGISKASYDKLNAYSATLPLDRAVAIALLDGTLPENKGKPTLCAPLFRTDSSAKSITILVHEVTHCAIAKLRFTKEYQEVVRPIFGVKSSVKPLAKYAYFEEFLISATMLMSDNKLVRYAYGISAKKQIAAGVNTAGSDGFRSLIRFVELCKDNSACSSEPMQMAKVLLSDKEMLLAIAMDQNDQAKIDGQWMSTIQ